MCFFLGFVQMCCHHRRFVDLRVSIVCLGLRFWVTQCLVSSFVIWVCWRPVPMLSACQSYAVFASALFPGLPLLVSQSSAPGFAFCTPCSRATHPIRSPKSRWSSAMTIRSPASPNECLQIFVSARICLHRSRVHCA